MEMSSTRACFMFTARRFIRKWLTRVHSWTQKGALQEGAFGACLAFLASDRCVLPHADAELLLRVKATALLKYLAPRLGEIQGPWFIGLATLDWDSGSAIEAANEIVGVGQPGWRQRVAQTTGRDADDVCTRINAADYPTDRLLSPYAKGSACWQLWLDMSSTQTGSDGETASMHGGDVTNPHYQKLVEWGLCCGAAGGPENSGSELFVKRVINLDDQARRTDTFGFALTAARRINLTRRNHCHRYNDEQRRVLLGRIRQKKADKRGAEQAEEKRREDAEQVYQALLAVPRRGENGGRLVLGGFKRPAAMRVGQEAPTAMLAVPAAVKDDLVEHDADVANSKEWNTPPRSTFLSNMQGRALAAAGVFVTFAAPLDYTTVPSSSALHAADVQLGIVAASDSYPVPQADCGKGLFVHPLQRSGAADVQFERPGDEPGPAFSAPMDSDNLTHGVLLCAPIWVKKSLLLSLNAQVETQPRVAPADGPHRLVTLFTLPLGSACEVMDEEDAAEDVEGQDEDVYEEEDEDGDEDEDEDEDE